ncbi:O-methyltransferase [soil metagenome]
MAEETWSAVDDYLTDRLLTLDPTLEAALRANREGGLPQIDVSATQGKLLHLLAKLHGAKTILEVGTLGGYSTIWLARALPEDGHLTTLELESKHAEVARKNLDNAGIGTKVEIKVGPAAKTLPALQGPFDMIFVDADKPSNPIYWREALRLSRPGTLIIVDNVIRNGGVADETSEDPGILGTREMMALIHEEPRVEATAIQTVGSKGYDGFLLARVK